MTYGGTTLNAFTMETRTERAENTKNFMAGAWRRRRFLGESGEAITREVRVFHISM